ncbi:MAG: TetR/AcrR family transcriptional regulator [Pseudomonadota bacterium]
MPRISDAQIRAIATASELFQQQGYNGTGLTQIIEQSGSPKGSFYYHFPEGKEQLAAAAVEYGSKEVLSLLAHAKKRSKGNAKHFVRDATRFLARWLEESEFRAGCPVTTIALEMTPKSPRLSETCSAAYASWEALIANYFVETGVARRRAKTLACGFVSGFLGAFALARAEQNTRSFEISAEICVELLDAE